LPQRARSPTVCRVKSSYLCVVALVLSSDRCYGEAWTVSVVTVFEVDLDVGKAKVSKTVEDVITLSQWLKGRHPPQEPKQSSAAPYS
jgi:hypothetical protein